MTNAEKLRGRINLFAPVYSGAKQGKSRTEAPVNVGRNYNGPKVAKSLVG